MSTPDELKTRLQQPMIVFMILLFSGLPIVLNSFFGDVQKVDGFANSFLKISMSPSSQTDKVIKFPQLAGAKTDSLKEVSKAIVAISH